MRKHGAMKRAQHYITPMQQTELNQVAKHTGVTASEHMRRAIDIYLALEVNKTILAASNPLQLELPLE